MCMKDREDILMKLRWGVLCSVQVVGDAAEALELRSVKPTPYLVASIEVAADPLGARAEPTSINWLMARIQRWQDNFASECDRISQMRSPIPG